MSPPTNVTMSLIQSLFEAASYLIATVDIGVCLQANFYPSTSGIFSTTQDCYSVSEAFHTFTVRYVLSQDQCEGLPTQIIVI